MHTENDAYSYVRLNNDNYYRRTQATGTERYREKRRSKLFGDYAKTRTPIRCAASSTWRVNSSYRVHKWLVRFKKKTRGVKTRNFEYMTITVCAASEILITPLSFSLAFKNNNIYIRYRFIIDM